MKTIYQKPETKVLIVNMHKMVCTSPGANTLQVGGTTSNEGDLLSRQRNDLWDDEE